MEYRVPDGEPCFNKRPQEKLKYRSLLLTGPGGSTQQASRAHPGSWRQTERQNLGPMPLLGSVGRVLWGSRVKAWSVNSNQKGKCFGKLCGGPYLRGSQREGPGRRGRLPNPGLLGKSYRELTFACEFGLVSRAHTAWPNKMDAEAAKPWSSLAKLSRTHHAIQCDMGVALRNRMNNRRGRLCSFKGLRWPLIPAGGCDWFLE